MHRYPNSKGKIIIASICIAGAFLLFGAALWEDDQSGAAEWQPLNEAMEAALNELERAQIAIPTAQSAITAPTVPTVPTSPISPDAQPQQNRAVSSEEPGDSVNSAEHLLDINRASSLELQSLKGIGPSKAQAIIDDRERNGFFQNVDDLLRVKGIGEKLLSGIKESIVASP